MGSSPVGFQRCLAQSERSFIGFCHAQDLWHQHGRGCARGHWPGPCTGSGAVHLPRRVPGPILPGESWAPRTCPASSYHGAPFSSFHLPKGTPASPPRGLCPEWVLLTPPTAIFLPPGL